MTVSSGDFSATLIDAARILVLGRALSAAQAATLSQRSEQGFLLGDVRSDRGDAPPFVASADADGHIGNAFPSPVVRDAALLHAALFRARPGAGAAILSRSPRLAAWGLSRRALPVRYFQMFGYTRAQEIPVADPNADAIGAVLAEHPDTPALLLSDGATLIWAPRPERAVRLVLSLEEAAHVTALADHLGGARDYPADAREKIYDSLRAQTRR